MNVLWVAAMVVITFVSVLNLFLLAGITRRLREYDTKFSTIFMPSDFRMGLKPGSMVPSFAVKTIDGSPLSEGACEHGTVILGFFDVHCHTCLEQAPRFQQMASLLTNGASSIASVSGGNDGGGQTHLLDSLRGVDHICTEDINGPLARAFEVDAFPIFMLVRDGVVQRSCPIVEDLAAELGT